MIYVCLALIFMNIAFAAGFGLTARRWLDHFSKVLEQRDNRESHLLLRIQAPQQAVAQQLAADVPAQPAPYIGGFDDDAAAEYENERDRVQRETHELIASIEGNG